MNMNMSNSDIIEKMKTALGDYNKTLKSNAEAGFTELLNQALNEITKNPAQYAITKKVFIYINVLDNNLNSFDCAFQATAFDSNMTEYTYSEGEKISNTSSYIADIFANACTSSGVELKVYITNDESCKKLVLGLCLE